MRADRAELQLKFSKLWIVSATNLRSCCLTTNPAGVCIRTTLSLVRSTIWKPTYIRMAVVPTLLCSLADDERHAEGSI